MADAYPEALERAFLSGIPIQLRVDLGGVLVPSTVPLCARGMQPGPPQFWVKAPALSDGRPMPAPAGAPVTVSYLLAGQRFAFDTELSASRPMPGDRQAAAWILQVPGMLAPQQRRAAYRLHQWTTPPLKARIWPIGPGPAAGTALLEGTIDDLSATGMGLLVTREASRPFLLGRILGLSFRLKPTLPPIVLRGSVRSRRARPKTPVVKLGVAFLEAMRGTDLLRSIDQLGHYVVEQERILIQRTRDAE